MNDCTGLISNIYLMKRKFSSGGRKRGINLTGGINLVLVILPDITSLQYESVQIHACSKDVQYMCLLGHIARICLHIKGVEFAM
jgi:hypothetical protein